MSQEDRLAAVFTDLADTLVRDFDVVDFLDMLARRAVELVEVAAAGILLTDGDGDGDGLRAAAASSEDPRLLDLLGVLAGTQPCVDCLAGVSPVLGADLAQLTLSSPALADHLPGTGYVSLDAFPMRLRQEAIGVMVLLRARNGSVPPNHRALSRALADVATIGLIQQRRIQEGHVLEEQLQAALDSGSSSSRPRGSSRSGPGSTSSRRSS